MANLPEPFIQAMQVQLGPGFDAFMESLRQPPPVSIRFNPAKITDFPGTPVPWCSTGRYLDLRPSFTLDPLFQAGAYYVQEASSMMLDLAVRQTAGTETPITALDLCAAPGGKSTHLLSLLAPGSLLVSNEAIRSRSHILTENLEKWGYPNVIVTQNDPEALGNLGEFFDLILVDAPCSGEGLFRRDPEAAREWSARNVAICAARQRRILADVWPALRPGGYLVYSTCTFNPTENQDNLRWLRDTSDCSFVKIRLDPSWGVNEVPVEPGGFGYQCLPHRVQGEGFFFAVVQKNGDFPRRTPRSKIRLQAPAVADLQVAREWLNHPDDTRFFLHGSQLRALPIGREVDLEALLSRLHVVMAGTGVGEIKKNKIVPDHALALSILRNRENVPGIPMDETVALKYLRMEPLPDLGVAEGFHVLEYKGLGLGWVNVLPGRVNNLFPSNRRIRMTAIG